MAPTTNQIKLKLKMHKVNLKACLVGSFGGSLLQVPPCN